MWTGRSWGIQLSSEDAAPNLGSMWMAAGAQVSIVRRWVLVALALGTGLLVGCGSDSDETSTTGADDPERRAHDFRPWVQAEATDDPTELTLVYWGPDASRDERCSSRDEAETQVAADGVLEATIYSYPTDADHDQADCPMVLRRIALHLDEPLGDGRLRVGYSDLEVQANAEGGYEPVAETTTCGRVDCSTPSPEPAPCDGEAVQDAFDSEVDGGIRATGETRCDGSFLVVDMDVGSSGCAPTEGGTSPCMRVKRAYFVANASRWRIVTYGTDQTCDQVLYATGIQYPAELC